MCNHLPSFLASVIHSVDFPCSLSYPVPLLVCVRPCRFGLLTWMQFARAGRARGAIQIAARGARGRARGARLSFLDKVLLPRLC